jgi:hypothetical protein
VHDGRFCVSALSTKCAMSAAKGRVPNDNVSSCVAQLCGTLACMKNQMSKTTKLLSTHQKAESPYRGTRTT